MARRINRRFVPLYFDLSPVGAASDRDARIFVCKAKRELAEFDIDPPPVMVMTPDGELLAEIDNFATEEQTIAALRDVLAQHPEWNRPSDEEARVARAGTPIERAEFLFDLGREDGACRLLDASTDEAATLLLAHFLQLMRKWDAMEAALSRLPAERRGDASRVEQAWHRLAARDDGAIGPLLAAVPATSSRYSEARYLIGLAEWHADRRDEALATWKALIEGCEQDRWSYRADWAYTFAKQGGEHGEFSSDGPRFSPLGRIGYGGRRPPDLEPRGE